jgi:hypothetical protein
VEEWIGMDVFLDGVRDGEMEECDEQMGGEMPEGWFCKPLLNLERGLEGVQNAHALPWIKSQIC